MNNSSHTRVSRMDRSNVMNTFYYGLTGSQPFNRITENSSLLDIAYGKASEIEIDGKYKNRTYLRTYRNRLEAIENKLNGDYNPIEAEEALTYLKKKIEAKKDSSLRSEVSRLQAKIRGKKQAKDYSDKLANSDDFKEYVNNATLDDISDGVAIIGGERKPVPHFNSLTNRVKAIELKLNKIDDYDQATAVTAYRSKIEYLGKRIEAKGDINLKKDLERIVGYELGSYELHKKPADVIDITHLTKKEAYPNRVALTGGIPRKAMVSTLISLSLIGGVFSFGVRDHALKKQAEALKEKATQLKRSGDYEQALEQAEKAKKIYTRRISKASDRDADGLIIDVKEDMTKIKKAKELLGEAIELKNQEKYEEALEKASKAKGLYSQDSSRDNDNATDPLITEINEGIKNAAEGYVQIVKQLLSEGKRGSAKAVAETAQDLIKKDSIKENDCDYDYLNELIAETEKGMENEAFLNKLYSDIQNKDLDAIGDGLTRLDELKKNYNAEKGFDGTAGYNRDEEVYNKLEELINNTVGKAEKNVNELISSGGFVAHNIANYIQNLENVKGDVNLLKVFGIDLSSPYEQALRRAYDIRDKLKPQAEKDVETKAEKPAKSWVWGVPVIGDAYNFLHYLNKDFWHKPANSVVNAAGSLFEIPQIIELGEKYTQEVYNRLEQTLQPLLEQHGDETIIRLYERKINGKQLTVLGLPGSDSDKPFLDIWNINSPDTSKPQATVYNTPGKRRNNEEAYDRITVNRAWQIIQEMKKKGVTPEGMSKENKLDAIVFSGGVDVKQEKRSNGYFWKNDKEINETRKQLNRTMFWGVVKTALTFFVGGNNIAKDNDITIPSSTGGSGWGND